MGVDGYGSNLLISSEMILSHVFPALSQRLSKGRPGSSGNIPNNVPIAGVSRFLISLLPLPLANGS